MSYWAILTCWGEHAHILGKADIIDCLVVSNELCLDNFFLHIPDCASGINAGSTNHIGLLLVPVEARDGSTVLWMLALNSQLAKTILHWTIYSWERRSLILRLLPKSLDILLTLPLNQALSLSKKGKRLSAYWVWNPHYFCWWILMLKDCTFLEFSLVVVELNDLNLVLGIFDKRT
jgi:hypothetical protein